MISRTVFFAASFIMLWMPSAAFSTIVPEGYDWRAADPLLYGQAVVEGVIAQVELRDVSSRSLGFSDYAPPTGTIATLVLSNSHCLRGAYLGQRVNAELFIDWRNLVGRRVILCSDWLTSFGDYLVRDKQQVLLFDNGSWERVAPPQRLADEDLRNQLAVLQPESLGRRADLVVAGRIVAATDSVVEVGSRMTGRIRRVTMRVESAAKSTPDRIVKFSGNEWEARVPQLKVDERWVAFLERRGGGYWISAGTNSLLKIGKDDELLLDGKAPVRLKWSQLEKSLGSKRYDN